MSPTTAEPKQIMWKIARKAGLGTFSELVAELARVSARVNAAGPKSGDFGYLNRCTFENRA